MLHQHTPRDAPDFVPDARVDQHAQRIQPDPHQRFSFLLSIAALYDTRALSADVHSNLVDLVVLLLAAAKGSITKS